MENEDELIVTLGRQLTELYIRSLVETPTSPDGFPAMTMYNMNTVARECLRQMQWNRVEGMDGDRTRPYEVTLAPPDWKPS